MTIPWNQIVEAVFNNLVVPLLSLVLVAAFALLLQAIFRWIPQGLARDALAQATRAAYEAAVYAQQVYISEIRKAGEDRQLTAEERQRALQLALDYWKTHAPVNAVQAMVPAGKTIEQWARELIESKVPEAKLLVAQATQAIRGNGSSQG